MTIEQSNNIVIFPKKNLNAKAVKDIEEIEHNMEMMKHYHIQETIANIAPLVFNQLEIAGFHVTDNDDDHDIKDGALIVEALRSIMCKYYGLYHPLQKIADNVFSENNEEIGTLKIVDELNVSLKDELKK